MIQKYVRRRGDALVPMNAPLAAGATSGIQNQAPCGYAMQLPSPVIVAGKGLIAKNETAGSDLSREQKYSKDYELSIGYFKIACTKHFHRLLLSDFENMQREIEDISRKNHRR